MLLHSQPPILITFPALVFIFKPVSQFSLSLFLFEKKEITLSLPSITGAAAHAASIIVYCLGPLFPKGTLRETRLFMRV